MGELHVELAEGDPRYRPGDIIHGQVRWVADDAPAAVEISLVWQTQGKGNEDAGVGPMQRIDRPAPEGTAAFELRAPAGPYSFAGTLIEFRWMVEAVLLPSRQATQVVVVISPGGQAVRLQKAASS